MLAVKIWAVRVWINRYHVRIRHNRVKENEGTDGVRIGLRKKAGNGAADGVSYEKYTRARSELILSDYLQQELAEVADDVQAVVSVGGIVGPRI
jgi:hypothetical protein